MADIAKTYKTLGGEWLFCLVIASVFIPVKIYPFVFFLACLVFYFDTPKLLRTYWVTFLCVFCGYATIVFFVDLPESSLELINFLKIPIVFTYLYFAVGWLVNRDNNRLLCMVDITLHLVLALTLIQLFVYHHAAGFQWIGGSPTSAKGNALYRPSLYFWGLIDKNMFGARIALLGFVYVLFPIARFQRVEWWRIVFVFLLAWLSLSRTPVVALLIGVFCLLWAGFNLRWRIVLAVVSVLAIPFLAQKILRIDTITSSSDGMGVRMVYWKAFVEYFTTISPLGNGFMSGRDFLVRYADFYHGEPHIHNTFMSCYLDFGIVGLLSYGLFLYYFYKFCLKFSLEKTFWWVTFVPLLAIMMILYSGYDNDIILYLVLIFLLGSSRIENVNEVKCRIAYE